MHDCEAYGFKHHLEFKGARHVTWLTGELWFKCRNCPTLLMVDRFQFYQAIGIKERV